MTREGGRSSKRLFSKVSFPMRSLPADHKSYEADEPSAGLASAPQGGLGAGLSSHTPVYSAPPGLNRAKRLSRLRFIWFFLGSAFGGLLAYYIVSALRPNTEYSALRDKNQALYALLETHMAALPAAPSALSALAPVAPKQESLGRLPEKTHEIAAHETVAHEMRGAHDVVVPVRRGDTLITLLSARGVASDEARLIVESMKKVYSPKRLSVGQSLELHFDKNRPMQAKPNISSLSVAVSPLVTIALSRTKQDTFIAQQIRAATVKNIARGGGVIRSSIYQTGVDSGVPPQLIHEVISALSYDVDFQRDIQPGDKLDMVYERMQTAKNITTGYGNMLYASLVRSGKELTIYRHVSPDGFSGYYNAHGESVKKALLRTPINGAHITSGFGMRMHPILGYSKMHKGVDFGAVTGTPIYAAGDGVVEEAGLKGGYGNYVRLRHSGTYATAYGHASRIAQGIVQGAHVRQGQIIAYVGSTGHATGPHLHYEILVNNLQVNPAGLKFRTGQTLQGAELVRFKREVSQVQTALVAVPQKSELAQK